MITAQHALVTGGGTGIGKAIAHELAEAGISVTICGRRKAALDEAAERHRHIHAIVADVTDQESVAALYRSAEGARGPFDIVVANAGVADSAPFEKITLSDWRRSLDVNLTGAFISVQPALSAMRKKKAGRIVFTASTAALKGYAYVAHYVAAKHGVVGLMRGLAVEVARYGVTVNAVCPGFTETDLLTASVDNVVKKTGRTVAEAKAEFEKLNPHGRLVQPEEVARAVMWLCDDLSSSVTGQTISISGGE